MSKRRQLLFALPTLAAGWAPVAVAQASGAVRRVGLLSGDNAPSMVATEKAFITAMASLGWQEGQNWRLERAYADRQLERLPAVAEALARSGVDVIVTGNSPTTLAAARATQRIPIVFRSVHYPLEQGLILSYARPGGNVTGPALFNGLDLTVKRLEFLRQCAPDAHRLAWIWPADLAELETVSGAKFEMRVPLERAARQQGYEPRIFSVAEADQLPEVLGQVIAWRTQAVSAAVYGSTKTVVTFALERRLPSAFPLRFFVAAGGLLSYGPKSFDGASATTQAAQYVNRLLRGAVAAELPVELPTRQELVVNLGTARTLGLTLPPALRSRADELIE